MDLPGRLGFINSLDYLHGGHYMADLAANFRLKHVSEQL